MKHKIKQKQTMNRVDIGVRYGYVLVCYHNYCHKVIGLCIN